MREFLPYGTAVLFASSPHLITTVAGVYMRTRQDKEAEQDWRDAAEYAYKHERLIMGGDMNAETRTAQERRGAQRTTPSDAILQGLVEDGKGPVLVVRYQNGSLDLPSPDGHAGDFTSH